MGGGRRIKNTRLPLQQSKLEASLGSMKPCLKRQNKQYSRFLECFLNFKYFINKKVWFGRGATADETRLSHTPEPPRDWKDKEHSCRSDVGYTEEATETGEISKHWNSGLWQKGRNLAVDAQQNYRKRDISLSRASAREKTDLHSERLRCMIWCDAKM